jgi:hypothetical protein
MVKLFWYALLLLMFTTSTTHALRQDQLAALRNAQVVLQAPAVLHVPKDGTGEGEITYTVTGFEGSWPHRLKVNMKTLFLWLLCNVSVLRDSAVLACAADRRNTHSLVVLTCHHRFTYASRTGVLVG